MYKKAFLNLFIEFGPIVSFLFFAEFFDFIFATKIFVGVTIFTVSLAYVVRGKPALFPLFASLIIVLTGLLTIFFTSPTFLIIETSLYNAVCAISAIGSLWLKKPILKLLFKDSFDIDDEGWRILTKRWAYMFVFSTISNEIVRIYFATEVWVDYKFFITLLTAVFGFYQLTLTKKHRLPHANALGIRVQ